MVILKKHYDPEPIVIAERYHFYRRSQNARESIAEYLASLSRLASRCKFRDFLDEELRDRLVCGMQSESTQKVLLSKADLTLEKALEAAQPRHGSRCRQVEGAEGIEAIALLQALCWLFTHLHEIAVVVVVEITIKVCVSSVTLPVTVHCGKVGHVAPACRSKAAGKPARGRPKKTKWRSSTTEHAYFPEENVTLPSEGPAESTEERLLVVGDKSSAPPYRVEFEVNGRPLKMEVETGAALSVAPESAIGALLPLTELEPTNVVLHTYTGEPIPVRGVLSVSVKYGGRSYPGLKLIVIQGSGPCLMGRDWLS